MEKEEKKMFDEIVTEAAEKAAAKTLETVVAPVTEKVFEQIMEKLPQRKDIFGGNKEEDIEQAKKDTASMFQKLANKEVKALTSGGSTSGAEMVPTYVSDKIERVSAAVGLVDKYGRPWPMQGNKENIPTASNVTAYRVNEGAKITSSQPTTGALALSSKTVGVLVPLSRKLLQNATPKVVDAIIMLAGEAFATLKDKWALLGLTSGEGVFQHASVPGVTMASTMTTYAKATPEDLLDVIDKVDDNISEDKLRWVLSRSVLNAFRKQRAAVGSDKQGFLFQGFGNSTPPTMWDIPYSQSPLFPKTTESAGAQADKKFMALVDFDKIIVGQDQGVTIEMSEQATITDTDGSTLINLFEQNMVAIKFSAEIDIQLADPTKAFAWLKTAAS